MHKSFLIRRATSVLSPLSLCVPANHYPKFLFNAVSSYLVLSKQIWISNMNIQCIHSNFIGEAGDWRCYEADKSMQVLVCKLYLHFAVPHDKLCSYSFHDSVIILTVDCTVTSLHGCGLGIYSNRREKEGVLLMYFSFETCIPAVQLHL